VTLILFLFVAGKDDTVNSQLMLSNCDSSWLKSFSPTSATADIARLSIGQFMALQSEALGSLDGNEMFAPVSETFLMSFHSVNGSFCLTQTAVFPM